ncbi:MAG: hypothetical protein PHQ20_01620 [Candidatus Moranbacteria bacterium]|nr:hypothetical protein [Candidatus Moranbacteria bacterium]
MKIRKSFRLSYLPPLMIYFAAGISGFTGIVESFFVKDYLDLSAASLAALSFWVGLPWALKMPLGHIADIFWPWKSVMVYLGAVLMAAGILIMIGLTGYPQFMVRYMTLDAWYILSSLLAPIGFVMQDVVADAMTVEAVPTFDQKGQLIPEKDVKEMHVTMQTLGRVAAVGGTAIVAGAGGWLAQSLSFKAMYEISLVLPFISVSGVILGHIMAGKKRRRLADQGFSRNRIDKMMRAKVETTPVNWLILAGSAVFILIALYFGLSNFNLKEELVFAVSLGAVIFLMRQIFKDIHASKRQEILSIALIIFVFRAMPNFGAGSSWWQIDILGFDERFFGTLRQISSVLAIVGMLVLRKWIAKHSLPFIVVFLTVFNAVLILPFIGIFYGLSQWTQLYLGFGARAIALIDTATASPLGYVAMIPMLAWIAENAPVNQKATYFAVLTAFANLALSASSLLTEYINNIFSIQRGSYANLGHLMIFVTVIGVLVPIATVLFFHPGRESLT